MQCKREGAFSSPGDGTRPPLLAHRFLGTPLDVDATPLASRTTAELPTAPRGLLVDLCPVPGASTRDLPISFTTPSQTVLQSCTTSHGVGERAGKPTLPTTSPEGPRMPFPFVSLEPASRSSLAVLSLRVQASTSIGTTGPDPLETRVCFGSPSVSRPPAPNRRRGSIDFSELKAPALRGQPRRAKHGKLSQCWVGWDAVLGRGGQACTRLRRRQLCV